MSVHKTKFKTYEVRWRMDGRQRSKRFDRKVDAEKFDASLRLDKVPDFILEKKKSIENEKTFSDLAETWLHDHAEVHKAPSGVIRDRQMIRDYLIPFIGNLRLSTINKRDIVKVQAELSRLAKIKPKTINNITGLCHKIFADAVGWGMLNSNPASHVKPIRCPEAEFRFWTFTERERFLNFIRARDRGLYGVVAFALCTGLRRGEVEGLQRDCLDFERREIIVKRNFCHKTHTLNEYTKGKRFRRVPMNNDIFEILKDRSFIPPNSRVFEMDFQHIVERHMRPFQKESGVSFISFHDLRHTFASHLAMLGVSVFIIQKLLGHTDIKTTMRYMHLAPDHLKGVTDVLEIKNGGGNAIVVGQNIAKETEGNLLKFALEKSGADRSILEVIERIG